MIQFDHVSDSFCVKDGDKWLYFDSVSKAKDAVRQVQIKEAALAERDRIVKWLKKGPPPRRLELFYRLADAIEAGEHLK